MRVEGSSFPSRQIWLGAVILSVLVAAPLSFFAHKLPWLICVPILLGTALLLLLELSRSWKPRHIQLPLKFPFITLPRDFLGLAGYKGHIALSIPASENVPDQETFDFLKSPRRKVSKTARLIKDESGEPIYIIDSDRFVTLLLNRILPNTDKATEVSILHALHRYGETRIVSIELEQFLKDKTVLDVIKSDFRGNTAQTINRSGEAVIRELIKEAKAATRIHSSAELQ